MYEIIINWFKQNAPNFYVDIRTNKEVIITGFCKACKHKISISVKDNTVIDLDSMSEILIDNNETIHFSCYVCNERLIYETFNDSNNLDLML